MGLVKKCFRKTPISEYYLNCPRLKCFGHKQFIDFKKNWKKMIYRAFCLFFADMKFGTCLVEWICMGPVFSLYPQQERWTHSNQSDKISIYCTTFNQSTSRHIGIHYNNNLGKIKELGVHCKNFSLRDEMFHLFWNTI